MARGSFQTASEGGKASGVTLPTLAFTSCFSERQRASGAEMWEEKSDCPAKGKRGAIANCAVASGTLIGRPRHRDEQPGLDFRSPLFPPEEGTNKHALCGKARQYALKSLRF
jgi:hypothetical protein